MPPKSELIFCGLCWKEYTMKQLEAHQKSKRHTRGVKFKCYTCNTGVSGLRALERHCKSTGCPPPPAASEFICCNCNINFPDSDTLHLHLKDTDIHKPREPGVLLIPKDPAAFCEDCNKEFASPAGLKTHLLSNKHKPLCTKFTCIAGSGCKKHFTAPSAMLHHLEHGTCKSGVSWRKLEDLMIKNDTTHIITTPDAAESRAASREKMLSAIGIDETSSVVSSADGGVILTPPGSGSRSSSFSSSSGSRPNFRYPTPSESGDEGSDHTITRRGSICSDDFVFDITPRREREDDSISSSGMMTPQSQSECDVEREYACPLCPENKKKFKSFSGLQTHMGSQVHASKIYHCPVGVSAEADGMQEGKEKRVKKFKTLSGLTQHIEGGSCEGGRQMFEVVMGFMNEKLKALGLRGMALTDRADSG